MCVVYEFKRGNWDESVTLRRMQGTRQQRRTRKNEGHGPRLRKAKPQTPMTGSCKEGHFRGERIRLTGGQRNGFWELILFW